MAAGLSVLACVAAIIVGRGAGPRLALAAEPNVVSGGPDAPRAPDSRGSQSLRSLGTVLGVQQRLEIAIAPAPLDVQHAIWYRVLDARTGEVLADALTPDQLAAQYPHLDPAGGLAGPQLMFADDNDAMIGW
jgi:hypothetical protein